MRVLFKPWQRNVAVVTLMVACATAGTWVTGYYREDTVECYLGRSMLGASSGHGAMLLSLARFPPCSDALSASPIQRSPLKRFHIDWSSSDISEPLEEIEPWKYANFESHYKLSQFICGTASYATVNQQFDKWYVLVPCWSITIPFTIMSLWLLVLNPRKREPRHVPDALLSDGT